MSERRLLIDAPDMPMTGCYRVLFKPILREEIELKDVRIASQPALAQGGELFARRLQQLRDYAQWEKDNAATDKQHILDWAVAALSATPNKQGKPT